MQYTCILCSDFSFKSEHTGYHTKYNTIFNVIYANAVLSAPQYIDGLIYILEYICLCGQKHPSLEKYEKCVNWKMGLKKEKRASQSVQG